MDNASGHGTWVNDTKLVAKTYVRLSQGAIVRFGASSRTYVFREPARRSVLAMDAAKPESPLNALNLAIKRTAESIDDPAQPRFRYKSTRMNQAQDFSEQ